MATKAAHIILQRDDAKRVFGERTDAGIAQVVQELAASEKQRSGGLVHDCGPEWSRLNEVLSALAGEQGDAGQPLLHCYLGGRPLHQGEELHAVLVRPDMVPHVAAALAEVSQEMLAQRVSNNTNGSMDDDLAKRLFELLLGTRQLFERASSERNAVLFTADRTAPAS